MAILAHEVLIFILGWATLMATASFRLISDGETAAASFMRRVCNFPQAGILSCLVTRAREAPMTKDKVDYRFAALWRFAAALTTFTILGHTLFGFEQSWAQPLVALATAYTLEILLEIVDARASRRELRFSGGVRPFLSFILPAHITGLAIAMLLYANDHLYPIAFAVAVAIASKAIFRVPTARGSQHFLNPSNFGITVTLLLFPWVGIAPPYHFTENLTGWGDWILPAFIIMSGTFLNAKYTKKLPLIIAWLAAFAAQAVLRGLVGDGSFSMLLPMTGMAFILFTFYMVSDPGTTPFPAKGQIIFGVSVAAVYAVLLSFHVVFGLFFALTIVCAVRGLGLYLRSLPRRAAEPNQGAAMPAMARRSEL